MERFWARTVVLGVEAEGTHDSEAQSHERFSEAYEGLEWMLSRNPERGHRMGENTDSPWLYFHGPDPMAGSPAIAVIYTFDINKVVIHSMLVRLPE